MVMMVVDVLIIMVHVSCVDGGTYHIFLSSFLVELMKKATNISHTCVSYVESYDSWNKVKS